MGSGSCKRRLFGALLLFGIANLVLMAYLKLAKVSSTPFKFFDAASVGQLRKQFTLTLNNSSSTPTSPLTTFHHQDHRDSHTNARDNNDSSDRVVLMSWGRAVKSRAEAWAPWRSPDNVDSGNITGSAFSSLFPAPLCPLEPPKLVGPLATYSQAPNWSEIVEQNPGLEAGGHYQPAQCRARHRVAVVVPYRDREQHLRVLLHNLHPMLIRQQLDYFVLVVEIAQPTKFNRGLLLNIGAVEALGLRDVQCFVFHDVDLIPENDRNLYTCPPSPRHMSAAVDKFKYKLPYGAILGGVMAINRENFSRINGYSNLYFGWGGEDDDLNTRVREGAKLRVSRYPMNIARYRMIKHTNDKNNEPNSARFSILRKTMKLMPTDGLNSLQYQVQKVEFRPAYTWILVSVNQSDYLDITAGAAKKQKEAQKRQETQNATSSLASRNGSQVEDVAQTMRNDSTVDNSNNNMSVQSTMLLPGAG